MAEIETTLESLTRCVAGYVAAESGSDKDIFYDAALQWLAQSYTDDGYTGAQIDAMDLHAALNDIIERF